jgi:hypothetical protein
VAAHLSPLAPGPRTRRGSARAAPPGDGLALQGVLWLLAAGLAAFTIRRAVSPHDEGLMLQAGARIASGQWPYRDFWTNYPPGQATLLAGLDELFGVSMLAWRVVWTLAAASASLLAFRLLRRDQVSLGVALLAWLAVAGAMAWPSNPEPNPVALTLALAALLAAPRRALLAGGLAGLAVFFRLEIGVAAVIGMLVLCAPQQRGRALGVAVAVAVVSLGPFFVAAPGAMAHDTIGFYGIQGAQRLPLPLDYHGSLKPDKLLEFFFPVALLAAALVLLVALVVQLRPPRTASRLAVALVPLGLVATLYLLARTDEFHLLPLSAVLAVALAASVGPRRPGDAPLRVLLLIGVAVIALAGLDRRAGQALHPPPAAAMPGPAGDGVQTTPDDARSLRRLIATVHRLVPAGDPIFVGDRRFDVVRVGDPLLYLTLNRRNPTRYDVMQPGVVTSAAVQREIIRALQRSHTRVVIRWLAATAEPSPLPAHPSGSDLLDRFIAAHYRVQSTVGSYRVLVAR